MKNRKIILTPAVLFLFLIQGVLFAGAETITKGALFPDVSFKDGLSKEERSYLGLSRKPNFSLKDIKGTLFIVEVFSTYCMSCPKDVPILNGIRSGIGNDTVLRDKTKVIGIAVGNTVTEIEAFKKQYGTSYPILADLHFALHKSLGNPRVPFTMLVKINARGPVIVHTHQGVLDSPDDLLMRARDFLSGERKQ